MKTIENIHYERKPLHTTAKSTLFIVSKDKCRNFMYCGMPKGISQAKVMSNSEKNQVHILSHCWVMLVWQSVTYGQSVSRKLNSTI